MDTTNTNTIIIACIGLYLIALLGLGFLANKRRKSNSLKEFYLAGSGLGSFVLLFTLYATQYSANTMLVTPAEVVNKGMGMILILGYMTAVVIFYLTFAPQLYNISKKFNFITPGDWFDYRFNLPKLTLLANVILVLVSVNFLLSQLMAMGHVVNGVTDGQVPYWAGVVSLAFVVIIYESLGGMRAVAWTDVIQGVMLFAGLVGLFLIVMPDTDELTKISAWLIKNEPQKIGVPEVSFRVYWASILLMIGLGGAVYPQVIQRIYAAKSIKSLRQSLGAMVVMPLVTVLILFLLGVISIPHFVDAQDVSKDTVLPIMLNVWGGDSALNFGLMVMVVVGLIAAIMSTADSVLLSLSSIVAKDILGKFRFKNASSERLTKIGKLFSWAIMFLMVLVALQPKITLWGLIELKMQILVQTAPLFLLGIHSQKVTSKGMFVGLCIGFVFATGAFFLGIKTIYNVHVGLIGFVLNILCCYIFSNPKRKVYEMSHNN
ncbi:sodium:solute symporter family protein [Seonamhaeicola sp.]|uniref:sodium:solute symporter family protein n=1 Tax=Seonamhaeicola sp. TaxID=1912245 RepID=UPI002613652E|nr:sodium:solute symporter family protein [Seonamhaeicola sp.]